MTTPAHVIVLGNEKGGAGKSTTAMQIFVALARAGHRVGALDLDLRQQSFFRYLDNRDAYAKRIGKPLLMPRRMNVTPSNAISRDHAAAEDQAQMAKTLAELSRDCAFVVIDTPGAVTPMAEAAHIAADTLVTPINDSLIDFDLLGRVDPVDGRVLGPSIYAEMVWSARQRRAARRMKPVDWVVLRNRIATLDSRNKRKVGNVIDELSKRIGFRVVPGFSERVIFRELFLSGLTLLDLKTNGPVPLTMSHVAARQEVREMIKALDLPGVGPIE
ncbi:MAG: division plane positioning ATPase MipZ [Paracoccaceae bacterium]|nr:division plane positioning ATPase MipZ [Paracoccaceae bacterium]